MAEDQVVKQDGLTQEDDFKKKKTSVKRKNRRVSSKKTREKSDDKKLIDKKSADKKSTDKKVVDILVSSDSVKKKTRKRRHRKKKPIQTVDTVATEEPVSAVDNSVTDESMVETSGPSVADSPVSGDTVSDSSVPGDVFQDEEIPDEGMGDDVNDDLNDDVSGDVSDDDSVSVDAEPADVSPQVQPEVQKDVAVKEPVGWENPNDFTGIGATYGAADEAATNSSATAWFGAPVSTEGEAVSSGGQMDQHFASDSSTASGQTPDWFSAPASENDFSNQAGESIDSSATENDDMQSNVSKFGSIDNSNQSEPARGSEFIGQSDKFTTKPEFVEKSEFIEKSDSINESKSTDESDFSNESVPEIKSDETPSYAPQVSTVQDVTDQDISSENDANQDGSDFMSMLAEAGIKKKHLFIIVGVFLSILLAIFIFIFAYNFGGEEKQSPGDKETVGVNVSKKSEKDDDKILKNDANDEKKEAISDESDGVTDLIASDNFRISGLINSYIFGLEFNQNRILQMLDTTPISEEGTLVGIDSSLAAGQDLQFKQEIISRNLDLLLKIENARALNIYDYLNKTTDRVAALNEHIRDLQSLLIQAEASKNTVVTQINVLNTEYTQITAQKNAYEKAFFDSVSRYYGNDSYNNLTLFTEASQLQVKVKANYNALKTLNAMFDTSIKTLRPRINDIVANFDALVKGVQVTEVKNSNINAIKF